MTRPPSKSLPASISDEADSEIPLPVDVAGLTASLRDIAQRALTINESAGLTVARQAFMDIAKLHGLLADRHQHEGHVTWLQILESIEARRGDGEEHDA